MLSPAPMPELPSSQHTTQLLPVAVDVRPPPWPLLGMMVTVFAGAVLVSFSIALASLTLASALRDAAQPHVIVAAPPLPAPVAPATPRR